jgi:hypothetical protein
MLRLNQLIGFGAGGFSGKVEYVGGRTATRAGATSGVTTMSLSGLTGGIDTVALPDDFIVFYGGAGDEGSSDVYSPELKLAYVDAATSSSPDITAMLQYGFVDALTQITVEASGLATNAQAMALKVFRGVDRNAPFDVKPTRSSLSTSGNANALAITPITPGSAIVACGAVEGTTSGVTISNMDGLIHASSSDTYSASVAMAHLLDWKEGSFDPAQFTNLSGNSRIAYSLALRPANFINSFNTAVLTGTATSQSSNTASAVVSLPSGIQVGDLLVAAIGCRDNRSYTWPAGWNEAGDANAGEYGSATVGWRIADGTEGATITVTASASATTMRHCSARFTGGFSTPPNVAGPTVDTGNIYWPSATMPMNLGIAVAGGRVTSSTTADEPWEKQWWEVAVENCGSSNPDSYIWMYYTSGGPSPDGPPWNSMSATWDHAAWTLGF